MTPDDVRAAAEQLVEFHERRHRLSAGHRGSFVRTRMGWLLHIKIRTHDALFNR